MFVASFSKLHKVIHGVESQAGAGQVRGLAAQATSTLKSEKPAGPQLWTHRGELSCDLYCPGRRVLSARAHFLRVLSPRSGGGEMPEFLQHSGGRDGLKPGLCYTPCWGLDTQPLSLKGHFFLVVFLPPGVLQFTHGPLRARRFWGDRGRTGPVPAPH